MNAGIVESEAIFAPAQRLQLGSIVIGPRRGKQSLYTVVSGMPGRHAGRIVFPYWHYKRKAASVKPKAGRR